MKIKLKNTITDATRGISFYKGKIYSGVIATNLPGFARISKNSGLRVKKVFVSKAADPENSMLAESADFEIVSLLTKEKDDAISHYLAGKLNIKKIKRLAPVGFKPRINFRLITEEEMEQLNVCKCQMNTADGVCSRDAKYIRNNPNGNCTVVCQRHGIVPASLIQ